MRLRDYQQKAVDAIENAFESHPATLVVMPTGTGKTQVFCELIGRRLHYGRAMVLAHRKELLTQAARRLKQVIGTIKGNNWNPLHPSHPLSASAMRAKHNAPNGAYEVKP